MLEDLFNVVKKRFNDEQEKPDMAKPVFKCPRCQSTINLQRFEELKKVCPTNTAHKINTLTFLNTRTLPTIDIVF